MSIFHHFTVLFFVVTVSCVLGAMATMNLTLALIALPSFVATIATLLLGDI